MSAELCLAGRDCDILNDVFGGAAPGEVVDRLVNALENWPNCSGACRALRDFVGDIAGIQIGKDKNVGRSELACLPCFRFKNLWQNRSIELNLASNG